MIENLEHLVIRLIRDIHPAARRVCRIGYKKRKRNYRANNPQQGRLCDKKNPIKKTTNQNEYEINFPKIFVYHDVTRQVLYENTLFPLSAALGRNSSQVIYTPTTLWKICLHCVTEDLKSYGTAYIHRRNLPTSVKICSIHGSALYYKCPTCLKPITSHKFDRYIECSNFYEDPQQEIGSPSHRFSIFISDLLNYDSEPFERHYIEVMIAKKLMIKGLFINGEGTKLLIDHIQHKLGLDINFPFLHKLTLEACAVSAFLAYQTADEYLKAMRDLSTWDVLDEELQELNLE